MLENRLEYLDEAKGFAILLIILGHIYPGDNYIKIWLYSFHVPLFFIITGVLTKHTEKCISLKQYIKRKFKRLIIPYITFELVGIFIWMLLNEFSFESFRWHVFDSIQMYCVVGALWFLPTLFVAEVIFFLARKYFKNNKTIIIINTLLFVLPVVFKTENHYLIVVLRCFVALGFITTGYYIYNNVVKVELKWTHMFSLFIVNTILALINGYVDLWGLDLGNILLYTSSGIIGSMTIIFLFKKINIRYLEYLGKNSIIIMATHQLILTYIVNTISGSERYGYIIGLIVAFIIILIEIPIIYLINNYLPWMLGKFKKREKLEVA